MSIEVYKEDFLTYLNKRVVLKEPENLYAPIQYILQIGGKRLRPILAIMTCDLFGKNPKKPLTLLWLLKCFIISHWFMMILWIVLL